MNPVLVGRELHKSYGPTPALRGASIAVGAGEIVAVMGPSGSGKSTILHCLSGILIPERGEVYFAGERIDRLPDRRRVELRRSAFGLVYQFGQLVPDLPVRENVALPLLLAGCPRRAYVPRTRAWLARMDLARLENHLPGELSGGQRQRVALARGLIARPKVLFADEPTGSLDSVGADDVMGLLVDAAKGQGTAVLVVTHEPRVAAFADRTVLLRDGVESPKVEGIRTGGAGTGPAVATGSDSLRVTAGDAESPADWGVR